MSKSCITCRYYRPLDVPVITKEYGVFGKCACGIADGHQLYNVYIPDGCCRNFSAREDLENERAAPSGG